LFCFFYVYFLLKFENSLNSKLIFFQNSKNV
jgi:hypothetical protein